MAPMPLSQEKNSLAINDGATRIKYSINEMSEPYDILETATTSRK